MAKISFTLSELAAKLNAEYVGDPDLALDGVGTLDEAGPGQLSFLANPKYAPLLGSTGAGAVVVDPGSVREGMAHIVTPKPYLAFAMAVTLFNPPSHPGSGVSPAAFVAPGAEVGEGATVMAGATVEEGASVGASTVIYPGCYVGRGAKIGAGCVLYPNVVVREKCVIGDRVILQPGSVIGSDGFGFALDAGGNLKFPQIGIVEIGDDVEIGANTTIDRAALGKTVIGRGAKVDNLVQIGHNVVIGSGAIIVAQVGISGSTKVGAGAILAGQVGVAGHLKIGDGAMIGAQSGIGNDVEPGQKAQGNPLMPLSQWLRSQAVFKKLPELKSRVGDLEKRLGAMEKNKEDEK